MTKNNYKQAMMPSRAVVFDNDAGSAPGFALSEGGKTVVCMPGPPREMTRMWQRSVRPYLEKLQTSVIFIRRCVSLALESPHWRRNFWI